MYMKNDKTNFSSLKILFYTRNRILELFLRHYFEAICLPFRCDKFVFYRVDFVYSDLGVI